jgi:hypothetical protein
MKKGYLVINATADGISVEMVSGEELEKRLNEDGLDGYYGADGFLEEINGTDPNDWEENKLLVVKGEIYKPTQERVVEKWKVGLF